MGLSRILFDYDPEIVKNTNTSVRFYFLSYLSKIKAFELTPRRISTHYSTPNSRWNSGSFLDSEAGSNNLLKFAIYSRDLNSKLVWYSD